MRKRSEVTRSPTPEESDTAADEALKAVGITPQSPERTTQALQASVEGQKKVPPPLFMTANKGPGLHPDFERIVETVFATHPHQDFEDLVRNLEVGDQRGDYATLLKALDKAEERARRAHALYLGAKLERSKWEVDHESILGGMRAHAVEALTEEKSTGDRKKQITDADVRAKMAELFPDEWKHQEARRVKVKGMEEHMERLADLWKTKCFSLSTMLSTLRK